ncbi:hypothetical protein MH117_05165 [Paenibacillus sp. ACRRX]|nr:hypothetical protein [Paenibacillus sp. ACRRX]
MPSITQGEAQTILRPYLSKLRSSILEPVNRYFSGPELALFRNKLSKRSDASNCHDLVVDCIKDCFDGVPKTRFIYKNKLFLLVIEERVVLRFKMFDQNRLGHGISTQQLIKLNYQEIEQLELPDMPPDGLLHVGYCINALRTGIESIHITYRHGNHNLWEWNITESEMNNVQQIAFTQEATTRQRRRRPQPKNKNVGDVVNENS